MSISHTVVCARSRPQELAKQASGQQHSSAIDVLAVAIA
jgi:hypothetical protein